MAKRKHHSKKPVHRRRRMGATGGTDFKQIAYMVLGGVAANVVEKVVPDNVAGMDVSKFKAAIPVAVGIVLPMVGKSPMMKSIGLGMVAVGGANLLKEAGIIGALGGDEAPMISAYERQAYLTASNSAPMVSGTPSYCG